jgi:hypothetical protein
LVEVAIQCPQHVTAGTQSSTRLGALNVFRITTISVLTTVYEKLAHTMIINPTHKITLSGLPPDILDAYVRYKKGTRAIVTWIVQFGPAELHGLRSLPLKELATLASTLTGRLKDLPEVVHFHFRETIAARKRLSKYFRGNVDELADDADTVNHEHFTSRYALVSLTRVR